MNNISYSVAIRTLGTAGEAYEKLLKSIEMQTIQPEKIIVVMPENSGPPSYISGTEQFVYCEKGMIIQRLYAMSFITSEYVLFCDDDVELSESFVEKLAEPMEKEDFSCTSGPLLEFFPPDTIKYKVASLLGGACIMIHGRKDYYVRILNTGGWSYNPQIDTGRHHLYKTESLAWTCFMIKRSAMEAITFMDEMWVEKFGYAAFEDRVMFYKLHKNGYLIGVVSDASYKHNDARTSTRDDTLAPLYARSFNHYVFWHRYIYSLCKTGIRKIWAVICVNYYILINQMYEFMLFVTGRIDRKRYLMKKKGFYDAKQYVRSNEYKNLPAVLKGC